MNNSKAVSFLEKIDQTIIGFMIGLLMPLLMFLFYKEIKFDYLSWDQYINSVKDFSVLPSFIKLSVFINLPVFFFFNIVQKFNLCKGIFIASLLYLSVMLIVKYIL